MGECYGYIECEVNQNQQHTSPRQNVQSLPERTAKILSEISRRGLFFHVAPHGKNPGIFIATHPKNLSRNA